MAVIQYNTNFNEEANSFIINLGLAGYKKEDISLEVENNLLTVKGTREDKDTKYILKERSGSDFEKSFRLPSSIKTEDISASFELGMLKINLPKLEKVTKQISIN